MTRSLFLLAITLVACSVFVYAQVPHTMNYQGVLTDPSGTPVPDGDVSLTFVLYDAATEGGALWTETQTVTVRRGVFSAILGKTTALNLPFNKTYWLGISVNGTEELSPRTELTSTPYALAAAEIVDSGKVVRSINTLTDSVLAIGEGGTTVTTRGDTLVISSIIPTGGGGGILGLQDPTASLSIANPNGPIATVSVANDGIRRLHIRNGSVVYSLNGLTDFVRLVEGQNIDITTITGAGANDIRIDALAQGGTVGGNLLVNGNLDVMGGSNHTGKEVFLGDIVAAGSNIILTGGATDTVRLSTNGLEFTRSKYGLNPLNVGPDGIRQKLHNKSQIILDTRGLRLVDSTGVSVDWEINADGTSYHFKKEYYEDTLVLEENSAIAFADGSVLTTAGGTGGVFQNVPLVVKDSLGVETFRVDPDGASFHYGPEYFEGGLIVVDSPSLLDVAVMDTSGKIRVSLDANDWIKAGNDDLSNEQPVVNVGKGIPDGANLAAKRAGVDWNRFGMPTLNGASDATISKTSQAEGPAIFGYSTRTDGVGIQAYLTNTSNTDPALWGLNTGGGSGVLGDIRNTSSIYPALWGYTVGTGSALLIDHAGPSGNILLGRSGAQATNVVRIDKTGKGFFNGGTQTGGADVAEAFAVEGSPASYEAGDVLVISRKSDRTVEQSAEPYSTLVAGVFATKPGVLLSERAIDESHHDLVPMGVMGVIPTKVTGENGPIRRGDLLVTSSISGHAMKGVDRSRLLGAVLGKALEDFEGPGTGVIRVLVNTR